MLGRGDVSKAPPRCGSCGEPVSPEARFCGACGTAVHVRRATSALLLAGWIAAGLLVALDLLLGISSLAPALIVVIPVTVLVFRRIERPGADLNRWGLALGLAALPLFLAYTNRHGPGTYCHSIGTPQYPGTECDDQWDPRPFAAVGAALVAAAIVAPLALRHRRRRLRS